MVGTHHCCCCCCLGNSGVEDQVLGIFFFYFISIQIGRNTFPNSIARYGKENLNFSEPLSALRTHGGFKLFHGSPHGRIFVPIVHSSISVSLFYSDQEAINSDSFNSRLVAPALHFRAYPRGGGGGGGTWVFRGVHTFVIKF